MKTKTGQVHEAHRVAWLVALFSLLIAGCASVHQFDSSGLDVIPLAQLVEDPSGWEEIDARIAKGEVVLCRAMPGLQLPLLLKADTPVGSVVKSESIFKFKSEMYLLMSTDQFQISPDGQRWADFGDLRAMEKLFDIGKGHVALTFTGSKDKATSIAVEMITH